MSFRFNLLVGFLFLLPVGCVQSEPDWDPIGAPTTDSTAPTTSNDSATSDQTTTATTSDETGADPAPHSYVVPGRIEAESFIRGTGVSEPRSAQTSCDTASSPEIPVVSSAEASDACFVGPVGDLNWIEFDVEVAETASFSLEAAVQGSSKAGIVSVLVDGVHRGRLDAPLAFGFQAARLEHVSLTAGSHVLRLSFDDGLTQVDYLEFAHTGACVPACAARACGDDFCGGTCGACEADGTCSASGQCVGDFLVPVETHGQLAVVDGEIVDEQGQVVQLRGVSTQWLNWEQDYSTSRTGLEFLRDEWGMQLLRIANGVENDNGYATESVRAERLELVKSIIDIAIELGLYVLVDWHTHQAAHLELSKEFFTEIAQTYGGQPHILYEPFNEPIGAFDSISGEGAEAAYWDDELKPYHESIVAHIRQYDPDNIIVLGTPQWSQGLQQPARNPVVGANLAYTLHFYSCTHGDWLMDRVSTAREAGLAVMATEWAATHSDGGTPDNPEPCIDEARVWHQFLDEQNISSAAWKLAADGDASSLFLNAAPSAGPFLDADLSEHGRLVKQLLQTR